MGGGGGRNQRTIITNLDIPISNQSNFVTTSLNYSELWRTYCKQKCQFGLQLYNAWLTAILQVQEWIPSRCCHHSTMHRGCSLDP